MLGSPAKLINPMPDVVASMFAMSPYVGRFMVGPEALADTTGVPRDRLILADDGSVKERIFVPGKHYTVVDKTHGVIQFGPEFTRPHGTFYEQPLGHIEGELGVPRLPEPRVANASMVIRSDIDRGQNKLSILRLFSALAVAGAELKYFIPAGTQHLASARGFFNCDFVATLDDEFVVFLFRMHQRFEKWHGIGDKDRYGLPVENRKTVEIRASLRRYADEVKFEGHEILRLGLHRFISKFIGDNLDIALTAERGNADSLKLFVSPDITIPDTLPGLCVDKEGIFLGETG